MVALKGAPNLSILSAGKALVMSRIQSILTLQDNMADSTSPRSGAASSAKDAYLQKVAKANEPKVRPREGKTTDASQANAFD